MACAKIAPPAANRSRFGVSARSFPRAPRRSARSVSSEISTTGVCPAALSAAIVGVAPLALSVLLFATGRVSIPSGAGAFGVAVVGLGLSLEVTGLVIVGAIIRRESR